MSQDCGGTKEKLERLYEKYKAVMHREAFRILHNQYDAEDAVQQCFLKLVSYVYKIREEEERMTYNFLKIAAKNTAIDLYNKKSSISKSEEPNIVLEEIEEPGYENVVEVILQKEAVGEITKAIDELPKIYRDVILFEKVYGYSRKETMKTLNVNLETIKKRITRGKAKLIENLERKRKE